MSSTAEGRKPAGRYAVERGLAPHVDQRWAQSFMVELRLIGIDGARIGEALSEVESHCSDGGQSAQDAFGSPVEYARSLHLPADVDHSPRAVLKSLVPMIVQILGMFMLNWSFESWLRGQRLEVTAGRLVITVGFLLGVLILVRFTDSVLRVAVYHPVRSAILAFFAFLATTATCVAALVLLDSAIWRGSAGWGLAVGAATLVGGVVWAIVRLGAPGSGEDPITSPFDTAGTPPGDEAPGQLRRLVGPSLLGTLTYTAMIPVGTTFLLAVSLVLHRISAGT
jgi:hypothetical protein